MDPGFYRQVWWITYRRYDGRGSDCRGTTSRPVILTSVNDSRYGGSGSYNTVSSSNSSTTSLPVAGDWGGVMSAAVHRQTSIQPLIAGVVAALVSKVDLLRSMPSKYTRANCDWRTVA